MPLDTRGLCQESLQDLIRRGRLKSYENSGKFIKPRVRHSIVPPELGLIAHYSVAEGPLYEDESQWEFAYRLVYSFTQRGRRNLQSQFTLHDPFGTFQGVQVDDLMSQLPHIFEQCGFRGYQPSRLARSAAFVSTGSCKVEQLPEPYGKWLQIQQRKPRWDRPVELEMEAVCNLSAPTKYVTRLDLTVSTLAMPLLELLAEKLGRLLGAAIPAPSFAYVLGEIGRAKGTEFLGERI